MTKLDQETVDRFVQLVAGGGLTQHECARAAGFSERHGERLLAKPEVRARVDALRARRAAIPEAKGVVEQLLEATDSQGRPDYAARAKGAEMWLKHQAAFTAVEAAEDDELPEGCYIVYPRPAATTTAR